MTNRMRLLRAANDIQKIKSDMAVSPTPYSHLDKAVEEIRAASRFALDMDEKGQKIDGFST